MPTLDQLLRDLEQTLELDPNTLKGDEALADINWDSMAVVVFIAMADANYGSAVHVSKLQEAKTVADLFALVTMPKG